MDASQSQAAPPSSATAQPAGEPDKHELQPNDQDHQQQQQQQQQIAEAMTTLTPAAPASQEVPVVSTSSQTLSQPAPNAATQSAPVPALVVGSATSTPTHTLKRELDVTLSTTQDGESSTANKKARLDPAPSSTNDAAASASIPSPSIARVQLLDAPVTAPSQSATAATGTGSTPLTIVRSLSPSIPTAAPPNVRSEVDRSASPAPSNGPSAQQAIDKVKASKAISDEDDTKAEIVKFVSSPESYSAPEGKGSLLSREYWFFELHELADDMSVILHLLPHKHKYTFRRMSKKEYGNWFTRSIHDANPEVPDEEKTNEELLKEIESIRTYAHAKVREAESLKPLQSEVERLRAEADTLRASLRSAQQSKESAQSDLAYIQAQYSQASTAAVLRANEAQAAEALVGTLRRQLESGLKARDEFQKAEARALRDQIGRLEKEVRLLRESERRSHSEGVREKASLWDAHLASIDLERERIDQGTDFMDELDDDEKLRFGLIYDDDDDDDEDEEEDVDDQSLDSQKGKKESLTLTGQVVNPQTTSTTAKGPENVAPLPILSNTTAPAEPQSKTETEAKTSV